MASGLLAVSLLLSSGAAQGFVSFSNSYISLRARDGWFDVLRVDPSGKSRYGDNLIQLLSVGVTPVVAPGVRVERRGETLVFRGLAARSPFRIGEQVTDKPVELTRGSTLGVKFALARGMMTRAGGQFPTWHSSVSGLKLSLYCLPTGDVSVREIVASRNLTKVPDNSFQYLEFSPQPPGTYYLEISEPVGKRIGWWGTGKRGDLGSVSYRDYKPVDGLQLSLVYSGFYEIVGDWSVSLSGSSFNSRFEPRSDPFEASEQLVVQMVTKWKKSGYDLAGFPFTRFYTDSGQNMLPQAMKRRNEWDQIRPSSWIYAVGKGNADVRFNLSAAQRLKWHMSDASVAWEFDGRTLDFDVLPHSDKLPDYYPVFYSSDPRTDAILNEFYYSHALNFGTGTGPDWKEWQALILDWTANPQRDSQREQLTGMNVRPDGYVAAWGDEEGWPFPFKDTDKDGKNDYDTRHFTTNPCFILGAYRYFAWTRDLAFIKEVMPKLRSAVAFDLQRMKGQEGIIIIDAPGHDGRPDGIGSNYWDILPFGWKDAYSNIYYYAALGAMADLEQFCLNAGVDAPGPRQSPEFYRTTMAKVRASYNREFWDEAKGRYVGCVDVDGVKRDYGFTFVNLEAIAYGLADEGQAARIYKWMETEPTSSGKADTYSRWGFAPRANTIHNPPRGKAPDGVPSWWFFGWSGTPYGDQCQDGGAILYTSYYDILARARFLGADNAYKRLVAILERYGKPDRLMGGSPLFYGESSQGGGNGPASVGVEGEFPENGLVPCAFLYAFLGVQADASGISIKPNLPTSLNYAGVRNLCYQGTSYDIRVTDRSVEITSLDPSQRVHIRRSIGRGECVVFTPGMLK